MATTSVIPKPYLAGPGSWRFGPALAKNFPWHPLPDLDRSRDTGVPSGNTIKPMEPNTGMREFPRNGRRPEHRKRTTAARATANVDEAPDEMVPFVAVVAHRR